MSQYPDIYAGQDITSGLLNSMLPQYAWVVSNTTRASTTTVTADPYLSFPVVSGSVYIIEFHVMFTGIIGVGMQTSWFTPSGTSGYRMCVGPASVANSPSADNETARLGSFAFTTLVTYAAARGSVTSPNTLVETAQLTAAANGDVSLGWAQAISNATGITMFAGSWGRCTQVG
jgi:hypothetical protein